MNNEFNKYSKSCFLSVLLNLSGVLTGEGMARFKKWPDSKNSGVLKTAECGNFKTVNYIVIGRFMTVIFYCERALN